MQQTREMSSIFAIPVSQEIDLSGARVADLLW